MYKKQLKALTVLLMCSAPWPVTDEPDHEGIIKDFADEQARAFGYTDWVDAYHELGDDL